jgi:hypothetical protein
MKVDVKSIGILIDELITTDIKCFMAQEDISSAKDDAAVADAARRAQQLNARRNQLIRAIDERIGEGILTVSEKTY